ncbi:PQQ-binding-like beta-propeller repeat protein [Phragmitibacter flavus]|nr:PQQ-binding-like beta-propeller repeat protein [Phragmitibacter flavus]
MNFDRLLLGLLMGTLTAGGLNAEEWSRFRGPNGSGVAEVKDVPVKLDDGTLAWSASVGKGWSSPVLWEGKVYLTAEASDSKRLVKCLDALDGSLLWSYELPYKEHKQHHFNTFASSTPFVNEAGVFVNWTNGETVEALALNHEGKLLWRRENLSAYVHEHGSGSSALVVDGVMVVRCEFQGPENVILGLDAKTGETKWKLPVETSKNTYSTPVVRETSKGREVMMANEANGFFGVDVVSGKMNWQHNPGYKQRSVGSFGFDGKRLFGTMGSGGGGKESALLDFSAGGDKPVEGYKLTAGIPYVPTPLVVDGLMYLLGDGGIFKCVDFATGEQIYEERLTGKGGSSTKFFSSPVAADGKIYCCSQRGEVLVLKAGKVFEVLEVSELGEAINATPALEEGRIYVRSGEELKVFGKKAKVKG